jgi:hypothetical protein
MELDYEAPRFDACGGLACQLSRPQALQSHFASGALSIRHAVISLKKILGLSEQVDEKRALSSQSFLAFGE